MLGARLAERLQLPDSRGAFAAAARPRALRCRVYEFERAPGADASEFSDWPSARVEPAIETQAELAELAKLTPARVTQSMNLLGLAVRMEGGALMPGMETLHYDAFLHATSNSDIGPE